MNTKRQKILKIQMKGIQKQTLEQLLKYIFCFYDEKKRNCLYSFAHKAIGCRAYRQLYIHISIHSLDSTMRLYLLYNLFHLNTLYMNTRGIYIFFFK